MNGPTGAQQNNPATPLIAALVLVASLAGMVALLRPIDNLRQNSAAQDALYIGSPHVLRRLSLGYTGLLADIYWTRAVQYFGERHHADAGDFRLLAPLLQVATELDPQLMPAYRFGANFLAPQPPSGAGFPGAAIELTKFGIAHNPGDWRLYYNLGFIYYTELKDYARAADAFAQGSRLPATSPFMPILAARMAQHAGEFDTARLLWSTTYQSTRDPIVRQNAVLHLQALQVDEDVTRLEQLVEKYRAERHRPPTDMGDLEQAGFFRGVPADPKGNPYKLTADGRVEVQGFKEMYFITKGLPPGAASPQPPRIGQKAK